MLATQRSLVATAAPLGAAVGAVLLDPLGPVLLVGLTTGACLLAGLAAASVRSVRVSR